VATGQDTGIVTDKCTDVISAVVWLSVKCCIFEHAFGLPQLKNTWLPVGNPCDDEAEWRKMLAMNVSTF
jgi:hypothetical protein